MNKKIAIIGAGSSGIAACKAALAAGIDFVCYEKGSFVGGNWVFNNDNNQSSCYETLHINTSSRMMSYEDMPIPEEFSDFPHHSQMASYFDRVANELGLRDHIRFNHSVTDVQKLENGHYRITTDQGSSDEVESVIVANGHHWSPNKITLPGHFSGKTLHSHDYKSIDVFSKEDRVLVVGFGNSAIDIACEAGRRLQNPAYISTRSRGWVFPKYVQGKPLDQVARPAKKWIPQKLQMIVYYIKMMRGIRSSIGRQEAFGIPTPDRHLFSDHPTISSELLYLSGHGRVKVKDAIKNIDGKTVTFVDGSKHDFDVIVQCTGYNISFPFLDSLVQVGANNEVDLYHRVVHPDHENLFFVGLVQPIGPVMPVAELQSRWIMKLLNGEVSLPSKKEMQAAIDAKKETIKNNLKASPRHTLEERFYPYIELMAGLIHPDNTKLRKRIVQSFVKRAS